MQDTKENMLILLIILSTNLLTKKTPKDKKKIKQRNIACIHTHLLTTLTKYKILIIQNYRKVQVNCIN